MSNYKAPKVPYFLDSILILAKSQFTSSESFKIDDS